ncbi:hypothetical protein ACOZ4B_11075 [Haloferax prahovense]|uniref:hypothetical protein n=1 Tax=Haloferax TaxID=2251 RepID=UPI000AE0BF6C|nr:hypothetical protein [Haloferax sp. Q22]
MDVRSIEGFGIDFVSRDDYSELTDCLQQVTGLEEEPRWCYMASSEVGSIQVQNWGDVSEGSEFSQVHLLVIEFPEDAPGMRTILLRIPDPELEHLLDSYENHTVDLRDIHERTTRAWNSIIPSDLPGIITQYKRSNKVPLSVEPPLTFVSTQAVCKDLQSKIPVPTGQLTSIDMLNFSEFFRGSAFCSEFGLSPNGLMSLDYITESSALLNAESRTSGVGPWKGYSGISVIEFHDKGKSNFYKLSTSDLQIGPFSSFLHNKSASNIVKLFPYISYYYWFRVQPAEIHDYSQGLRRMPRRVDENHTGEFIDLLQEAQAGFYDEYIDLLDKTDSAERLLKGQQGMSFAYSGTGGGSVQFTGSQQEIPIPINEDKPLPNPAYRPDIVGVFSAVKHDLYMSNESSIKQYNRFEERYSIAVEMLNRQLDLQLSDKNRQLSETSVYLEQNVNKLTIAMAVLTAILVLDAFGLFGVVGNRISEMAQWWIGALS